MIETVTNYFFYVNHSHWVKFYGLFSWDVRFTGPFAFKADNLPGLVPFYSLIESITLAGMDRMDIPIHVLISENTAVAMILATAEVQGLAKDFLAVDLFVIEDGTIKELDIRFDLFEMPGNLSPLFCNLPVEN